MKKEVLLITDINFWVESAGHRVRILRLVRFLSTNVNLTIIYIGKEHEFTENYLSHRLNVSFKYLTQKKEYSQQKNALLLKQYINSNNFSHCIIEYIHNSYFLKVIPESVITILDTHDLINERFHSFSTFNCEDPRDAISEADELEIFDYYNYIMLICDTDYEKVKQFIPEEKLLLTPHAPYTCKRQPRAKVNNIGFIGSEYYPNVDAMIYFIENIWLQFYKKWHITLSVYGNVSKGLTHPRYQLPGILYKGYEQNINTIYDEIDVVINPVRMGAGLKIKTVEALANSLPLVTSLHGAKGLEENRNKAFLVYNDDTEFIDTLDKIICDFALRQKLSSGSHELITTTFNPLTCYGKLLDIINN